MKGIKKLFASLCLMSILSTVPCNFLPNVQNNGNCGFKCKVYSSDSGLKKSSYGNFKYELSNDYSCYVIGMEEMGLFGAHDVFEYLDNGGVIMVNDSSVSLDDFKEMADYDFGSVSFLGEEKQGSVLFKNNDKLDVWSYSLEFLNDLEINDDGLLIDKISEAYNEISIEQFAEWVYTVIQNIIGDNNEEPYPEEIEEERDLGTAKTFVMVPLLSKPSELVCSYKIMATVKQGQKYFDKDTGLSHGIYDIITDFGVDAEENYAITKYVPRIYTDEDILDETYIQSDDVTQYTLGGKIGFDGVKLGADFEYDYTYTVSSTGQEVVNDFPYGRNYRGWQMKPTKDDNFGASYRVQPGIRIISRNDRKEMSASLNFNTIEARDRGFLWIFYSKLALADSYRHTLKISWTANDVLSQTEDIG